MRKSYGFVFVLMLLPALAPVAVASAADGNIGIWKLNLAKSKYSPGPPPRSQTLKIEAWGEEGVKYASDGEDADGKPIHMEFQAKYDGKDYPFKGNPDADTIAYTRIDPHTLEAITKIRGKVNIRARAAISKDGKTRTLTQKGKDSQGRDVNNVIVYDRQ